MLLYLLGSSEKQNMSFSEKNIVKLLSSVAKSTRSAKTNIVIDLRLNPY